MRNLILGLFLVGFVYCAPTNTTFSCDSTNTHCPTKTCILTKSGTCFESSCATAGQCKSFKNCSPKDETCCCKTMNCWKNQKVDICEDEPEEEEEPTSTPALKTVKAKALAKPIAPLAKNTIAPKPVSTSKPASVKVAPKKAAPKSIATTEAPTTTTEEEGEQEPTTETATESSEVEETTVTEDENTSTEEHDDEILKKEADLEDEEETTTEEPQESTTDTEEEDEDEEETTTPVEDEENSTTDEPEITTESEDDETTTDTDEETSEEEVESTTPENESNEVHPVASTKDSEEDETASDDSDDDTFMQSRSRKLPAPIHASAKSHSSVESTTMHVMTSSISNSKTSKEKSSAPIPWWSACLLGLIVASAVFCSVAIYLKRRKEKAAMANRRRSEPKKTDKLVDQLLLEKQAESQA